MLNKNMPIMKIVLITKTLDRKIMLIKNGNE